jgi:hypothetical protein
MNSQKHFKSISANQKRIATHGPITSHANLNFFNNSPPPVTKSPSRSGENDKHDESKEKRIHSYQGGVAAEVEGQDHAHHRQQETARCFPFQILTHQ